MTPNKLLGACNSETRDKADIPSGTHDESHVFTVIDQTDLIQPCSKRSNVDDVNHAAVSEEQVSCVNPRFHLNQDPGHQEHKAHEPAHSDEPLYSHLVEPISQEGI